MNRAQPREVESAENAEQQPILSSQVDLFTLDGDPGYVVDNMEGAVDQAVFLAKVDMPVAIIGARGTGKMYIAQVVHEAAGGSPEDMIVLDCHELRSREQSFRKICALVDHCKDQTLVFKSPHLMHPDTQDRVARMVSTRTFFNEKPPRYLPRVRLLAVFPETLEKLVAQERLSRKLASAFAGYPIVVPPLKDRGKAVLRWGEKILGQEAARRNRSIKGLTPDAERAMLAHKWTGNITEVRERIIEALDYSDHEWITAADIGLHDAGDTATEPTTNGAAFLDWASEGADTQEVYTPTALEELESLVAAMVAREVASPSGAPLGTWLQDELVTATLERYDGEQGRAASFLCTQARNLGRWAPRIAERTATRHAYRDWREVARLVRDWVRALPAEPPSPPATLEKLLLIQLERSGDNVTSREKSRLLGVSVPTYQKRLKHYDIGDSSGDNDAAGTAV
ncbi:sigma 54-interacting transcriptional regulator [Halioglobus pacificus]|uniref:Sigma-54 factor interaction domain-containing protein n=1 Tax=Parahalioglobus pacificus TaxID=930806 RepID=A0A918XK82_9GAMM|nr:sigma 54-interacting transcriptional regulator [Halioglobus pacificus]NQY03839.1 sigma 54-interacting transcriptional regulator [Halieaceae bacterium]GHD34758.1 hypothetical protein GCM10007053_20890 [Halioglobus pacificus]